MKNIKNISIEIVARNPEQFKKECELISQLKSVNIETLNIPDLLRFDVRSWDAAVLGQEYFSSSIPHLRAIDFNLREDFKLIPFFKKHNIDSVLVITGDKPQDMSKKVYRNSCLELIRILHREQPNLKIYAGIDPYRSSLRDELDYIEDKLIAGVYGFFTQPFFDINLLEIYMDHLKAYNVFWGISPVVSTGSQNYWESKNNVVFPTTFEPTMEWNVNFAKKALKCIDAHCSRVYFMPIRVDIEKYLTSVFA
jgi:methylenetetrahydrofolate reductase (NADPH)